MKMPPGSRYSPITLDDSEDEVFDVLCDVDEALYLQDEETYTWLRSEPPEPYPQHEETLEFYDGAVNLFRLLRNRSLKYLQPHSMC